jgi:hypothetical protein
VLGLVIAQVLNRGAASQGREINRSAVLLEARRSRAGHVLAESMRSSHTSDVLNKSVVMF